MHEDVDQIRHYVQLLSRIITLIAVILAVPVILSTITAFARNPPEVSTFHHLLGTAFVNARGRTIVAERTGQESTLWHANLADPQEAGATETEKAAPEGPLPVDHPRDAPPAAPSARQNSAMQKVADGASGVVPPSMTNNGAPGDRTDHVAPVGPASATEAEAHPLSASAPLPGPIQLPRPRPHKAGTLRTADTTPSGVPMPRPRPVADDSDARQDASAPGQQQ
jgi:hypothetical protein